ncbi:hypothetical protein D3C87_1188380 [compost metagenome]
MAKADTSSWFDDWSSVIKNGSLDRIEKKAKKKKKAQSVAKAVKGVMKAASKDVPPWEDIEEVKPKAKKAKSDKMGRKEVADDIKMKVARYYAKKGWGVNFELGVRKKGKLRADVFALAFKGYAVIVEVKSCVADFMTDYKAKGYLKYCNQFYFAFNHATWEKLKDKVDFPPSVGVILIDHKLNTIKFEKKSKRRELDPDTLLELALRAAYRGAQFRSLDDIKSGGRFK